MLSKEQLLLLVVGLPRLLATIVVAASSDAGFRHHRNEIRTRSILNVIQEKQAAQDDNILTLKNEIAHLRSEQQRDHDILVNLQEMVNDGSWATANLKTQQDQIQHDVHEIKRVQQVQNESFVRIQDYVVNSQSMDVSTQTNIKELQYEVSSINSLITHDRTMLFHLMSEMSILNSSVTEKNKHKNDVTNPHEYEPLAFLEGSGAGGSSRGSGESSRIDSIASELEENDNMIGHNIPNYASSDARTHSNMDEMHQKVMQYDTDIAKLHVMFFNLSLQISTLENHLLHMQHQLHNYEGSEIQKTFMNITQAILNLGNSQMSSTWSVNSSTQHPNHVSGLESTLENQRIRISTLETLLLEYHTQQGKDNLRTDQQVGHVEERMEDIEQKLEDYSRKASDVLVGVNEKLAEYNTRIQQNNDHIAAVEYKQLNASLNKCEKGSSDVSQDLKLIKLEANMENMDIMLSDQRKSGQRMDRGLSRLYDEVNRQSRTLNEVMDHAQLLLNLVPNVSLVESEVRKIINTYPQDCSAHLEGNNHQNGVYLIRPQYSNNSVQTYCEADADGLWTHVQHRLDGSVDFARTWAEYRAGFGDPKGEFWLGTEDLHRLTTQDDYMLHIDMWDLQDQYWYADYDYFKVDEESAQYRLHIDGYHGNATDALRYSNFMPFSTLDVDNDVSSTHCAKFYTAGWWYKHCHYSNLNGRYTVGVVWFNHDFDEWVQLKKVVMKVKLLRNNKTAILSSNEIPTL